MAYNVSLNNEVSIVVCGEAGQGTDTVAHILSKIFKLEGYNIFSTKEYMSRIRGGCNSTQLRVSSVPISSYSEKIDILIPLTKDAVQHMKNFISENTIIISEGSNINTSTDSEYKFIDVDFSKIAKDIGNIIYTNSLAAGLICGLFSIKPNNLELYLKERFSKKPDDVIQNNILAAKKGYDIGKNIISTEDININIKLNPSIKDELMLSGYESISMGCIAGGCNFISSYPMSPSTGVLTFLSAQAENFGIIAEQAEDEISAINMALGAWYAGSRAMVTTSGGGFALMTEGVSLAGMIESPIIIHIAQRPGPATGLPTRTEQGDLNLALYAGHGDFARIILTPGNLEDAFYLSGTAFNLADKYQIPVFILTDQFLMDSYHNIKPFDLEKITINNHIIETGESYQRYKLTDSGLSPRGIPAHGTGLVLVDSDEHNEEGHITENLETRINMVDKRLKRFDLIKNEIIPPELIGPTNYKHLIIGWGTTYGAITEALTKIKRNDTAYLYFKQVYPLQESIINFLNKATTTILVENNATGQFGSLIKQLTGFDIKLKILKYNGLPFSTEELANKISAIINEE